MKPFASAIPGRERRALGYAVVVLCLSAGPLFAEFGDAQKGAEVLRRRQCTACHSVQGTGGGSAPDLGRRSPRGFAPATLAAMMWNHGPAMWRSMAERNLPVPELTTTEINDLYAYFYSLRYFDPPGDAGRGKDVFVSKSCSSCHTLSAAEPRKKGAAVTDWPALADPVLWTQHMWNHGSRMAAEMEQAGMAWPSFTVQQMVDLLVYVQNLPGLPGRMSTLRFGDPGAGEAVLREKGCDGCHTVGATAPGKIDLSGAARRVRTLTGLAVQMWNHRPLMAARAGRQQVELKPFEEDEMGQLLGYLYEKGYFEQRGNLRRGQRAFKAKGCASCHDSGTSDAPSLRGRDKGISVPAIASAIWRHGPTMLAAMERQGTRWPTMTDRDVVDLIEYLNSE